MVEFQQQFINKHVHKIVAGTALMDGGMARMNTRSNVAANHGRTNWGVRAEQRTFPKASRNVGLGGNLRIKMVICCSHCWDACPRVRS